MFTNIAILARNASQKGGISRPKKKGLRRKQTIPDQGIRSSKFLGEIFVLLSAGEEVRTKARKFLAEIADCNSQAYIAYVKRSKR